MILNTRGGIQFLFILTLPLLISFFLVLAFIKKITTDTAQKQLICRNELLNAQVLAGKKISQLINLNPHSKKLKNNLQSAKLKFAACPHPACRAFYQARILMIQGQQVALSLKQQSLIFEGNLLLQKGLSTFRDIINGTNQFKNQFFERQFHHIESVGFFKLAVTPDYKGIAPTYKLKQNFQQQQQIGVKWSMTSSLQTILPKKFQSSFACYSTLEGTPENFIAVLRADRLFLKSYLY